MIRKFIEAYLLEIILCAGCLLAGPLARIIVSREDAHEEDRDEARKTIRLVFFIIFAGLLLLSLLLFEH
jgi:hypothetical protein